MRGMFCINQESVDWIKEQEEKLKELSEKQYQLEYDLRSIKLLRKEIEKSVEKALDNL
jgi:hypothetical protein